MKLRVTGLAGSNAPALAEIAVILPRGLRFNMSGLARGVIITGPSAKRRLRLRNRRLTIKLNTATRDVSVTIGHRATTMSPGLATKVKRHEVNMLMVVVNVTDARGNRTNFISHLSTRRH